MPKVSAPGRWVTLYFQVPQDLAGALEALRLETQEDTGTRIPMGHVLARLLRSHPTVQRAFERQAKAGAKAIRHPQSA
jgi:hypothetical protein